MKHKANFHNRECCQVKHKTEERHHAKWWFFFFSLSSSPRWKTNCFLYIVDEKNKSPQVPMDVCIYVWRRISTLCVHSPLTLSILNLHCQYHLNSLYCMAYMNKKLIQILCLFIHMCDTLSRVSEREENFLFMMFVYEVEVMWKIEKFIMLESSVESQFAHYKFPLVPSGHYKHSRRIKTVQNHKNNTSFE